MKVVSQWMRCEGKHLTLQRTRSSLGLQVYGCAYYPAIRITLTDQAQGQGLRCEQALIKHESEHLQYSWHFNQWETAWQRDAVILSFVCRCSQGFVVLSFSCVVLCCAVFLMLCCVAGVESNPETPKKNRRKPCCGFCRNHLKEVPVINHQCHYANCDCVFCKLTRKRRTIMKHQQS